MSKKKKKEAKKPQGGTYELTEKGRQAEFKEGGLQALIAAAVKSGPSSVASVVDALPVAKFKSAEARRNTVAFYFSAWKKKGLLRKAKASR